MIILDTNVLSELIKEHPNESVLNWIDKQSIDSLYLTSVTIAEMLFGIAILPKGKRENSLTHFFQSTCDIFENRILVFDMIAAKHYARLAAMAKSKGRAFPVPDGYIAAIAAGKNFFVASRDVSPFQAVHIGTVNPWKT